MTMLKNYDKEALASNQKLTAKMQKYVKREDFVPDKVKSVSNAATSLCMWVRAMDTYGRVARSIEPKKGAELKQVKDRVAALQAQLAATQAKAEKLERDQAECTVKLGRAQKLLVGLGSE